MPIASTDLTDATFHRNQMSFNAPRSRTPRVLLCVHQFFPEFGAGTEVLVLSTAKAMRNLGYEVRVVTGTYSSQTPGCGHTYLVQGITIHSIHTPYIPGEFTENSVSDEYDNPRVEHAFAAVLDEFRPDLVHFFHFKNLTLASLRQCIQRSIATVFTPTDFWLACRTCQLIKPWGESECEGPNNLASNCLRHTLANVRKPLIAQFAKFTPTVVFSMIAMGLKLLPSRKLIRLKRLAVDLARRRGHIADQLSQVDAFLAPTRSLEKLLLDGGLASSRIKLLRYAIEAPVPPAKSSPRLPGMPLRVGYIGTLVEHKGCHVLLQAVRKLTASDMKLSIYGDPRHYPAYSEQLAELAGADHRIEFLGTFAAESIGHVMAELDVLVIPSTWRENAPLVLLNALACGLPVIASDVTGITEYLDEGDDVSLFPAGNIGALAELLNNRASSRRVHTRPSAPGRVAGSSLHLYATALDDAYNQLITRAPDHLEKV